MEVTADLDYRSAPSVRRLLWDLVESGVEQVLVDLSAVPWIDAAGLGVLTGAYRRSQANGGEFRTVVAKSLRALMNTSGISRFIPVYESMGAAEVDLGW